MIAEPTVYKKENSFIDIRQDELECKTVYERIQRLRESLHNLSLADKVSAIIKKACDDILALSENGSSSGFTLHDFVVQELMLVKDLDLPRYLFYRYRYEMYPKQKIVDDYPPCLQIEPASMCNYRCIFCYQTDKVITP